MPVSLVTSRPNSPRDLNTDLPRRRNEQPLAPQPPLATVENDNVVVEQSTSPTPSISALLEDHDPMLALGGGDNAFTGSVNIPTFFLFIFQKPYRPSLDIEQLFLGSEKGH